MSELKPLLNPASPGAAPLEVQLEELFMNAAKEAGAYVFDHPDQHSFNAVFGAHQVTVSIVPR